MNHLGATWKIRSGHPTKMSRFTVSNFPATSLQSRSTQPRVGCPKHRSRSGGKGLTLGHLTRVNRVEPGVSRKLERHNQEPTGDRACLFITPLKPLVTHLHHHTPI